ncbi:MAG: TIGR01777 family oxidoreductase [Bernardetiaceae bacterium]|nr:TIGR01777 family oxidoreductase [Bernardetiaceae bacterium]
MENILITGGTGLVGTRLTEILQSSGKYKVSYLSRSKQNIPNVEVGLWDVEAGELDEQLFQKADYIVHLAGANVFEKAWTDKRKTVINDSRELSTYLLTEKLRKLDHKVKAFISASAIGYYGYDTGEAWQTEADLPGQDFLARVTQKWEDAAEEAKEVTRTVKLRVGIVLSDKGGALLQIAKPIKFYAGAALASGKQYLSWIHIDDLARMFLYAIENENMSGTFNAVAPNPVTNSTITRMIADVLDKKLILPNVPAPVLYLALGEQANLVIGGLRVSCEKIKEAGFEFAYSDAQDAIRDLLAPTKS